MRLRLVVSEAVRSIGASMSTTLAATITVLIGMFVLGLTIALGTWVLAWSDHVKDQLLVKVYFCVTSAEGCHNKDATPKQIDNVRIALVKDQRVESSKFVSRQQALVRMQKKFPSFVKDLAFNPLPASYEVRAKRAEDLPLIRRDLVAAHFPAVHEINDGGKTQKRVLKVGQIVSVVFLAAVIILLACATLLIANTIRLSIFARRREIEVMKLVGATNWFVRGPFMLEGLICGLIGSVVAVILLVIGDSVVLPALDIGHSKDAHAIPFELNALIILGAGLILGAAGSGLTLRRFLRV